MFHELRAIIGEYRLKWIGKDFTDDPEEFSGGQRRMALGCPGKSESRVVIGKCYDVSPDAIQKVLHRVKGAALSGSSGFISFGFSTFWGLFSLQSLTFRSKLYRPTAHLIRCIGNQPTNGSRFGTTLFLCFTENLHKWIKLLLAQIGMHCPQSSDLFVDLFWPNPLSSFSWRPGLLIERLDTLITFSELAPPVIERSPFDLKRLYRWFQPIFLPKL